MCTLFVHTLGASLCWRLGRASRHEKATSLTRQSGFMLWDETKRQSVIEERGVDILYAALIFEGPVLTKPDNRRDYGEQRKISIGMVGDECFVVVHTEVDGESGS